MRYSTEEQLQRIKLRTRQRRSRQSRQTTALLSGAAVCLTAASAAALSVFSGSEASYVAGSAYGAFLLSSRSGSYVLCGMIAFVCGSAFTILCIRRKRKQDEKTEKELQTPHAQSPARNEPA